MNDKDAIWEWCRHCGYMFPEPANRDDLLCNFICPYCKQRVSRGPSVITGSGVNELPPRDPNSRDINSIDDIRRLGNLYSPDKNDDLFLACAYLSMAIKQGAVDKNLTNKIKSFTFFDTWINVLPWIIEALDKQTTDRLSKAINELLLTNDDWLYYFFDDTLDFENFMPQCFVNTIKILRINNPQVDWAKFLPRDVLFEKDLNCECPTWYPAIYLLGKQYFYSKNFPWAYKLIRKLKLFNELTAYSDDAIKEEFKSYDIIDDVPTAKSITQLSEDIFKGWCNSEQIEDDIEKLIDTNQRLEQKVNAHKANDALHTKFQKILDTDRSSGKFLRFQQ